MSKVLKENSKPNKEMTELTIAELNAVNGGRLNAGGVNPIVISRDRALSGS